MDLASPLTDNKKPLRDLASFILSFALMELYPHALLVESGSDSLGFFVSFSVDDPLPKEALSLLEERMYSLIKEGKALKQIEMVPQSAHGFFKAHKEPYLAMIASNTEGLVSIIQMDGKGVIGSIAKGINKEMLKAFSLIAIEEKKPIPFFKRKVPLFTIRGYAGDNSYDVKKQSKRLSQEKGHLEIGEKRGLFLILQEGLIWHEEGMSLKKKFYERIEREREKWNAIKVEAADESTLFSYLLSEKEGRRVATWQEASFGNGEDLFQTEKARRDLLLVRVTKETVLDEVTFVFSKLKEWISQIGKKVGHVAFFPKQGEVKEALSPWPFNESLETKIHQEKTALILFWAEDSYQRKWPLSSIEVEKRGESFFVKGSYIVSLERMVALFLEGNIL